MPAALRDDTVERMFRAVEKVRERLLRAAGALRRAGIDYAVAGGHAVAAWVAQVDEGAVRNTRDVDILIRPQDLDRVRAAMEQAGFVYHNLSGNGRFHRRRRRIPGYWLAGIRVPVFVLEGTNGTSNIAFLKLMAAQNNNSKVHFHPVEGCNHFSLLAPATELVATKLVADTGKDCEISFTISELNELARK